jgi:four helix bundle protein
MLTNVAVSASFCAETEMPSLSSLKSLGIPGGIFGMVTASSARMAYDDYDLIGRAQKYAAAAFAFCEQFPFSTKGWHAADQFYRASSSATSNYCAAKRGRSTAEFISKLAVVVEEIDEAVRWLEHMRDISISVDVDLFSEAEQLRRIWGASLGTARRNEKARLQRLKDARAKRRREKQSKPRRYSNPT